MGTTNSKAPSTQHNFRHSASRLRRSYGAKASCGRKPRVSVFLRCEATGNSGTTADAARNSGTAANATGNSGTAANATASTTASTTANNEH